jgi:hypothetical protein
MMKSIPRIFHDELFVLATTGPGLVSRTLAEYRGACDQVKVLFPEDVCDPNSWYRFGAYGVHLQVGTWRKREGLVRRVLHRYWESMTRKALLKESAKRGGERSLQFKRSFSRDDQVFELPERLPVGGHFQGRSSAIRPRPR